MAPLVRSLGIKWRLAEPRAKLTLRNSMYGSGYNFSRQFFTGWVIVSLLWAIFAFSSVTIYPIIEGRHLLASWTRALLGKGSGGQDVDAFDHHQHRQRFDPPESSRASRSGESLGPEILVNPPQHRDSVKVPLASVAG